MQPLAENLKLIDRAMIAAYFQMLFQHVEPGDYAGMLRGIGEGGTSQEGLFRENVTLPITASPDIDIAKVVSCANRWGQHHVASFIVPAAMDKSIFYDAKGTEDRVKLFTTVLIDLDKGDTDGALAWLTKYIGEPTMEVMSGGITETGQFKRHIYWALKEPTAEVAKVALVRGMIASKVGGDPSFKRIAQVVRIPGTVYAKGGVAKTCTIDKHRAHVEMELSDLVERANDMPMSHAALDMFQPARDYANSLYTNAMNGQVSFAQFAGQEPAQPVGKQLVEPIHAGGDGDNTRWSRFNEVAGHYIHCARVGQMSLPDAYDKTLGWVRTSMVPPWPDARMRTEFNALALKDIKAHGKFEMEAEGHGASGPAAWGEMDSVALPATSLTAASPSAESVTASPSTIPVWAQPMMKPAEQGRVFDVIARWDVARLTSGDKPKRQFLIEGLIQAGKPHLLAAEGGAGKTGQILDMGMKIAGYMLDHTEAGGDRLRFWGQALTALCAGKAVAIVTSEDDEEECHIRLKDMDEYGLLARCAGKLFVVPLVDVGGAFPFVHKGRYGDAEPSKDFKALFDDLAKIPNLGLVIVDTLNSTLHGEDVRPDVIQEYFNQLVPKVCGQWGCALIVTHHIRKAGKTPIKSLADMKEAVRGSSALPAAVRAVIGFWHDPDYKNRLKGIGEAVEPGKCYLAGVVKANNNEFYRGTKTLLRDRWGVFIDKTNAARKVSQQAVGATLEQKAWIRAVVSRSIADRQAFSKTGKGGFYERKAQLPECLQRIGKNAWPALIDSLLASEQEAELKLTQVRRAGSGEHFVLDLPGACPSGQQRYWDAGEWSVTWDEQYTYNGLMAVHPVSKK